MIEIWREELYHSGKKGMRWGQPKRPRTEPYKVYGRTSVTYDVNPADKSQRYRNTKAYSKSNSTHYYDSISRHIRRGSADTRQNPVGSNRLRNNKVGRKKRIENGRVFVKKLFS